MRNSGCEVPEYMLQMKKTTKKDAKKLELNVPSRKRISTEPFPDKQKRERREKWRVSDQQPPAKRPKLQPKLTKSPKLKKSPIKKTKLRQSPSKLQQPASKKHKIKKSPSLKKSKQTS